MTNIQDGGVFVNITDEMRADFVSSSLTETGDIGDIVLKRDVLGAYSQWLTVEHGRYSAGIHPSEAGELYAFMESILGPLAEAIDANGHRVFVGLVLHVPKIKTTPAHLQQSMNIPDDLPWVFTGKRLGGGGQGNVWLVTNREDNHRTKYALKVLRNSAPLQARMRFRREIEVIQSIDHNSIIRIHDFSEEVDDFQFYVMDYFKDAKPLAEIIFQPDTNPFHGDTLKCLTLFEDIIKAIQAYEQDDDSIVHRDISPNNILLLPDGSIRLIDFGICQIENDETITLADEHFGTRFYAPPECGPQDSTPVKIYTDIYSAAKVLWSTITSKKVFDREEYVFNEMSMKSLFPNKTETWHLNRIFQKTIRQNPNDRHTKSEEVLLQISDVKRLVRGGYPPQEVAHRFCPSCGQNQLGKFDDPYHIFGNPSRRNASPSVCKACGFVSVHNYDLINEMANRINDLR